MDSRIINIRMDEHTLDVLGEWSFYHNIHTRFADKIEAVRVACLQMRYFWNNLYPALLLAGKLCLQMG